MTEEEMAEAQNWVITNAKDYNLGDETAFDFAERAFLAGLEAGKDIAETDLATVAYMQGAERYKPKWHKVADEGLPINKNDGATYLLYTIYGEGGSPVVAHFAYRDKQELMNVWTGAILTEDKIVAWKEIVLPKEIKENDRQR